MRLRTESRSGLVDGREAFKFSLAHDATRVSKTHDLTEVSSRPQTSETSVSLVTKAHLEKVVFHLSIWELDSDLRCLPPQGLAIAKTFYHY